MDGGKRSDHKGDTLRETAPEVNEKMCNEWGGGAPYHRGLCPFCITIGSGSCTDWVSKRFSDLMCFKSGTIGFWDSTILHVPVPLNIVSISHELFAKFTREPLCPINPLPGKYVLTGQPVRFSGFKQ